MAVERRSVSLTLGAILVVVALLSVLPFAWIICGSFKPHLEIQRGNVWPWQAYEVEKPAGQFVTLDNYRKIADKLSGLPTYYFNTVYLAMAGTLLSLLVGSLAAYGLAQFRFAGNKLLFTLLLLTIMIPGEVTLIGQYELMFKLRLYDRIAGLLAAYTAGNLLLVIFIMRNVFLSIPQDLVDAAMIDGAGTWRVFWDLMVPIGRNGLAACAILTFLGIWNEFLFALTFTSTEAVRTLPVGITLLKGQWGLFNSGVLFATVLLSFLPIVIVFVLLQKYFVRGLSAGAIKA
ncbi:MAG TPA: carbohydrate ABC transporter permease [Planctomycetota bacterium]|nr:carbohydrate ABC transporter permease [Planctomycetota bacterium]